MSMFHPSYSTIVQSSALYLNVEERYRFYLDISIVVMPVRKHKSFICIFSRY